jgi:protein-S-isoprenylcysteine O-methyltransferase Ste14
VDGCAAAHAADTRTIRDGIASVQELHHSAGCGYSAAFVWLWTWLAISVRSFDEKLTVALPLWLRPVGFVLAAAGALLAGRCIATFVTKGRGTPAPFDPPREFVASGPYRYVRNPMYVGATAVMLGAGLVLSSPAIVMLALGFLLIMHLFVVLYEEPALAGRFGASYQQYRSSVHRWLIRKPKSNALRGVD